VVEVARNPYYCLDIMRTPELTERQAAQILVESTSDSSNRVASASSPFVIGVTGHRGIAEADLALARGSVAAFFDTIRLLLPDTELTVMLGLTADSDLVVAETALERGIRVIELPATGASGDSPFVYWLPIAGGGSDAGVAAATPCFLTALGDTLLRFKSRPPDALRRRLEQMNDYNRDVRRIVAHYDTMLGDSSLAAVPADLPLEDRATLAQISAEYAKADMLALHYQKRSDRLFGMFGVFAFAMGCLYLIYDKLGENQGFLLAYLVILPSSLVLYRLLYTKDWFVKHLRYRTLAETLRVKFYLCLAGVGRSVDPAELLALSGIEHFDGFGWIGYVLKNVDPIGLGPAPSLDPRRGDYVRQAWVDDQYRYFSRKVRQLEQMSRRVSRGQMAVVVTTVLVLLTRMLFMQSMDSVYVIPAVPLKNVLMLGAGIMALFLGAWKLHQSKMATRELI
jgi:hypothetical protein